MAAGGHLRELRINDSSRKGPELGLFPGGLFIVKEGALAVINRAHDVAAALPVPHQLIIAREGPGLFLLPLDDRRDRVIELRLGDGACLLADALHGVVGGQGDLHLHIDLGSVLAGVAHPLEGGAEHLVKVGAEGVEGIAFQ